MTHSHRNKHSYTLAICMSTLLSIGSYVKGHGRLLEPPSRSSASRFGFAIPHNDNDNQLSCGGFWNQWGINQGRCGICGDPYQGPRENEAGGKYATGTIVRHYTEGQNINIEIEMTVGHGGWSEFRICPNNDIYKAATQQCLDKYLLATPNGQTRILHTHRIGVYKYILKLPRGLTCSQCVLQWRWNTDSNNNCNFVTGKNCCTGCGTQEQFYGCSDVSIKHASNPGYHVTSKTSRAPVTFKGNVVRPSRPYGFIPIDLFGRDLYESK